MAASVRIDDDAFTDDRITVLAELLGALSMDKGELMANKCRQEADHRLLGEYRIDGEWFHLNSSTRPVLDRFGVAP